MSTEKDDDAQRAVPDDAQLSRRRFDPKLVIGLTLSFLFVTTIITYAVLTHEDDGCSRWESQVAELSTALTRHRLVEGRRRLSALQALESLSLPCAKVDSARDACVAAYRQLLLAKREQRRAKRAVKTLEKAVAELDEPLREVARQRIIKNHEINEIADALSLTREETRERVSKAMLEIGPDRLERLHGEFEAAVKSAAEHVKNGDRENKRCDIAFKQLVEQSQSR